MIKRLLVILLATLLIMPNARALPISPSPAPHPTLAMKNLSVVKISTKKKITLSPSPSPKWPPLGFKSNGEVYAKIPTPKELVGTASNSRLLTRQLAQIVDGVRICEKYSCGAVQLASLNGCTWWEVNAKLQGVTSATDKTLRVFGTLRTLARATSPRQITTVLLISKEDIALKHVIAGISANCYHDATNEKIPSSIYTPVEITD
ncbi:unannotated protein [freshwater metagenome]|uniref:Unannotated protein n=1 Tax=freshwater metagenome TaxID=449393 RepID=A0A6J7DD90_9ZZZZ